MQVTCHPRLGGARPTGGRGSPEFQPALQLFEHPRKILIIQKSHLWIYIHIFVNHKH